MRVLGISSSPRKGGNSDILLDSVLEGAWRGGSEVDKISLRDVCYEPCRECGKCAETGRCVVRDGMGRIYRAVSEADAIIVATPIFFGSVTAQLKAMIDRFQSEWCRASARKGRNAKGGVRKIGVFLSVADTGKARYFNNAKEIVTFFFNIIGAKYSYEMLIGGVTARGDIVLKEKAIRRAFKLGLNLSGKKTK